MIDLKFVSSRMEMVENVCLMNAVPVNGSDRFPVLGSTYERVQFRLSGIAPDVGH